MGFEYQEESGREYLVQRVDNLSELDNVTIGMLENNEIKGILPFFLIQENSSIELKYDISGYETVKSKYVGKVNKAKLLKLLKAICDVYETCENYMIDSSQLLLDQSCIFVQKRNETIKFILNPLISSDQNTNSKLREMILTLDFDRGEDCTYVAELLQYFNRNTVFSLNEFSAMIGDIDKLRTRSSQTVQPQKKVQRETEHVENRVARERVVQNQEYENEEEQVGEEKKGFFLFGKKSKGEKPSKNTKKKTGFSGLAIPGVEDGGYSKGTVEIPQKAQNIKAQKVEIETYDADEEDFGATELHRREEEGPGYQRVIRNYEILRTSTGERYPVTGQVIKIGRKNSIVDICVLGNAHIGRLHAILYKQEDGLFIEDNASGNGVFVGSPDKENRIVPRNKILLKVGEYFYLGDEEFCVCGN